MEKTFQNPKLILVIILLLASFLRLWKLSEVPISLFADELDVGYQAYSILKTGKDYTGNPWPIHFQSFAEFRTPLYIYSSVLTVALFGISPYGVRLPAAVFGVLGIFFFYLLTRQVTGNWKLGALASLLLAISPWHIQYSRGGFEVTEMMVLYLAGIYFFLLSFKNAKFLVLSVFLLVLAPWTYSTAKFFIPITIVALCAIWWKDLLRFQKKYLILAVALLIIIGFPIAYSTFFGGGTVRFGHLSVFTDPTTPHEVDVARLLDGRMRDGKSQIGIITTLPDRTFHNKIIWWAQVIGNNYLQSFSTQFLFTNGDLNLRHSPSGIGQLYKIEAIFLILGIISFFKYPFDRKVKIFLILWLLSAPLPAAITRDGGMHATRLFFLLPSLVLMAALGVNSTYQFLNSRWKKIFLGSVIGVYLVSFAFYQHNYWVHYPWNSERWWHAGFEEAIKTAVSESDKYEKVIITMMGEPPFIFFLGYSLYPPNQFQAVHNKEQFLPQETVPYFGTISSLGKYYFGSPSPSVSLDELSSILPDNTLYIASHKEVDINLILDPDRLPKDLTLVQAVAYPSGEPAFYLFAKTK